MSSSEREQIEAKGLRTGLRVSEHSKSKKNRKNPKRETAGSVSIIGGEQSQKKCSRVKGADQLHQMPLMGQERRSPTGSVSTSGTLLRGAPWRGSTKPTHAPSGNGTQNHREIAASHLSDWQLSESQEMTNVGEDEDKRESLCTAGEEVEPPWRAEMEISQKT